MLDSKYDEQSKDFFLFHEWKAGAKLFVLRDANTGKWTEVEPTRVKYKLLISHKLDDFKKSH